jgi:hypothetical protein
MPTPASVGAVSGARGMAFRLIGIVYEAGASDAVRIAAHGAAAIVFRDVAALVRSCSPRADPPDEAAMLEHHTIIAGLARATTIIPAPRSRSSARRRPFCSGSSCTPLPWQTGWRMPRGAAARA